MKTYRKLNSTNVTKFTSSNTFGHSCLFILIQLHELNIRLTLKRLPGLINGLVSGKADIINNLITGEVYMLTSEGRHPYKKNGHIYRLVEPSQ